MTLPGMTIVCGDSHATHGAFGSLAFGIWHLRVEHVLATRPEAEAGQNHEDWESPAMPPGHYRQGIVLAVISKTGSAGGTGHVVEFCGKAIEGVKWRPHDPVQHNGDRNGA